MKIKNKIFTALLALVCVCSVSCKKYLDINTSPLTATKVDPKLLFGYAVTAWDVNKNSGDNAIMFAFLGQTLANGGDYSSNWGSFNIYNLSSTSLQNTWQVYYVTGGNNLKQAIKIAEETGKVKAAAQCKIVFAQMMFEATTAFGDIPYSEAFQPDAFSYPKVDSQESVLNNLLALLDEAIAQASTPPSATDLPITDYDIFYAGSMTKWANLARSIKFKILMTMVDKDPTKAAAIGALLAAPTSMISSAADNWRVRYTTTANNENPKYRLFVGLDPATYAIDYNINFMVPRNDPRLPRYFDIGIGGTPGVYTGVHENAEADATTSTWSNYLLRKDAPSLLLSYQELTLLKAEAYARGLGVPVNMATANTLLREGVTAAMTFYEADPAAITTYVNTQLPVLTAVSPTAALNEIHMQQWTDLMDRPMEAFLQWRRSGPEGAEIPAMTIPVNATAGPLIRRLTLPLNETLTNPSIPKPIPVYTAKQWFDL